jgi:hypothetical protein
VTEDYADFTHAVEGADFFTAFMPIERVGDRIVCASHQYPEGHERRGLHGNSFWVAKRGFDWFVAGWGPAICRVPELSDWPGQRIQQDREWGDRAFE